MNQVRKGFVGNTEVREKAEVDWTISSHMDFLPTWKGQDFFLRMRRATEGSPPGTEEARSGGSTQAMRYKMNQRKAEMKSGKLMSSQRKLGRKNDDLNSDTVTRNEKRCTDLKGE